MTATPVMAEDAAPDTARIAYDLELSGIGLGWGVVELALKEQGRYQVDIGMKLKILFWSAGVSGAADGMVDDGEIKPNMCSATVLQEGKPPVELWAGFEDDTVTNWAISPNLEEKYEEGCIPLAKVDVERTLDPLSALFVYAESAAEVCNRTVPIFAFGTRLDLTLTPGRGIETGVYSCGVSYQPNAGLREESESVQILRRAPPKLSIFEIFPGLWAPHNVGLPTRLGSLTFTHQSH